MANGAVGVAALWHVVLAAAGVALALGWRPSQRAAGQLLAAPLLSVALVGIAFATVFQALVFGALAAAVFALARRGSIEAVRIGPPTATAIAILMLGIGWIYPHFLAGRSSSTYLYAAPLGAVPCPTLYAVAGFALLGATPRAASNVLALAGLFFGLFGLLRLGVRLDLGLVIGSAALALQALRSPAPCRQTLRNTAPARRSRSGHVNCC